MRSMATLMEKPRKVSWGNRAAQVAICKNAFDMVIRVDHDGHAQPFARHLQQTITQRRGGRNARQSVAFTHEV